MTDNTNIDPFLQSEQIDAARENELVKPFVSQFAGVQGIGAEILPRNLTQDERFEEEKIQRDIEEGRTVIQSYTNGKFGAVEDKGSASDRGWQAMQSEGDKMLTTGWGEVNLPFERKMAAVVNRGQVQWMEPSTDAYSWSSTGRGVVDYFADFGRYFARPFTGNETMDDINKRLAVVDPKFDMQARIDEVRKFQKESPSAYEYLQRVGVDPVMATASATNIDAFRVQLFQSMESAVYDRNIQEFNNNWWSGIARGYNSFTHNPTMLRDMAVLTALTAGYGTIMRLGVGSVRAIAAGEEVTMASRAAAAAARAASAAQKVTGPMTGLLEGPMFLALRGGGMSGARILGARTLAIMTDAAAQAGVSSLVEQHAQYEWRQLLTKDPEDRFQYDFVEAGKNMAVAALVSTGMLAFMRFGIGGILGDIGNVSHGFKTGDWSKLGKSVANSLDGWATTKEGLIVYGNKLSEGRGVAFGNMIDNAMKRIDKRSSASILMNGSRLFGHVDAHIAAKMNLDIAEASESIKSFERITGIAGEAAMRGVADASKEASTVFSRMMDKNFLADNGITHGTVARLFNDYEMAMKKSGGVFPTQVDAAGNILTHAATHEDKIGALGRLVEAHIIDRNLREYDINSADIIAELGTLSGQKPMLSWENQFDNFKEIAIHRVGDKAENSMLEILAPLVKLAKNPEDEVKLMGRTIPLSVAGDIAKKALETSASKDNDLSLRFITNGGTDTDKASFVLMYDPITGEVTKTNRKLVYVDGQVKTEFEVHKNQFYTPERTVSVKEINTKLLEMQGEVDRIWKETMRGKLEKLVKEGKVDAVAMKKFTELWDAGVAPTAKNLKKIFGLKTAAQSTAANIIMKVLGYTDGEDILRIGKAQKGSISEGATANIVFEATNHLIQSTKNSDLGSIVHEMGHYNRLMFLQEGNLRDREAVGITEGMWNNFLKWVGNEDNIWRNDAKYDELKVKADAGDIEAKAKIEAIHKAEEKYANGFAYYMKSVMKGEGKAPDSAIQRLMHKLGDHLGQLGERFKTQEALEAGLGMTDEAAEVYSKLLNRSQDKVGDYLDAAFRSVFAKLTKDERDAIGTHVLGEAMWKDHVAKHQKMRAAAKAATDGPVERSKVPKVSKQTVIDNIHAELSGGVTKKFLRQAIDAGLTIEQIKARLVELDAIETALWKPENMLVLDGIGNAKPNAVQRNKIVKMLREDPELMKRFESQAKNPKSLQMMVDYKIIVQDKAIADSLELVGLSQNARAKLVERAKTAPPPKKAKPSDIVTGSAVALAALEKVERAPIVDSRGVPVDLSSTERAVVVDTALRTAEGERTIAKAAVTAVKVEETVDLDALLGMSREPSTLETPIPIPEKVIVHDSEPGTLVVEPVKTEEVAPKPKPVIIEMGSIGNNPPPLLARADAPMSIGLRWEEALRNGDSGPANLVELPPSEVKPPKWVGTMDEVYEMQRFKEMGETDAIDPEILSLVEQVRAERAAISSTETSELAPSPEGVKPMEAASEASAAPIEALAPDVPAEVAAKVETVIEAAAPVTPTIARRKAKPSAAPSEVEVTVRVIQAEVAAETGEPIPVTKTPEPTSAPKAEVVEVLESPTATRAEKIEAVKKVEEQLAESTEPAAVAAKEVVTEVREKLEAKKTPDLTDSQKVQMQAAMEITDGVWRSFREGKITVKEIAEVRAELKGVTNDYKKDAFFRWVTDHKNKELRTLFYQDAALRRRWSMDSTADAGRMAATLDALLAVESKERSLQYEPVAPRDKAVKNGTEPTTTQTPEPRQTKLNEPTPAPVSGGVSLPKPAVVEVVKTESVATPAPTNPHATLVKMVGEALLKENMNGLILESSMDVLKRGLESVRDKASLQAFMKWAKKHKSPISKFMTEKALVKAFKEDPLVIARMLRDEIFGTNETAPTVVRQIEGKTEHEKFMNERSVLRLGDKETVHESRSFRVRSQATIAAENLQRQMIAASNTLDELPENAKAVLKKIVARVRKSGTIEELAEVWKFYLADQKYEVPRPSHSYIEAELKFVITSESFADLKGMTAAEIKAYVHVYDIVQENLTEAVVEFAIRNPSPEAFKRVQDVVGIPMQYMEIYVRGARQINAAPDVADFNKAFNYVSEHAASQTELVKYIEDNEEKYVSAKETKTNKEFVDDYNNKLRQRSTFVNAENRMKLGVIPEQVANLDCDKALEKNLLWDVSNDSAYPVVIEAYMKVAESDRGVDVGIDDIVAELSNNTRLQDKLVKMLGVEGDPEEVMKAWAAGEESFLDQPFKADGNNEAKRYLRKVISRMTMDNVSRERTKKGVLNIVGTNKKTGEEVEMGVGENFRLNRDHEDNMARVHESEYLTLAASFLYDRLVAEGDVELADFFAARRATTKFAGSKQDKLELAYSRRASERSGKPVEVTAAMIDRLEERLKNEMQRLADELINLGVTGSAAAMIRDGQMNLISSKHMVDMKLAKELQDMERVDVPLPPKEMEKPKGWLSPEEKEALKQRQRSEFWGGDAPAQKRKAAVRKEQADAMDQAIHEVIPETGERIDLEKLMNDMKTNPYVGWDKEAKSVLFDVAFGNIRNADQLVDSLLKKIERTGISDYGPLVDVLKAMRNLPNSKKVLKSYATAMTDHAEWGAYVRFANRIVAFKPHNDLYTIVHELQHVFTSEYIFEMEELAGLHGMRDRGGWKSSRAKAQRMVEWCTQELSNPDNHKTYKGEPLAIVKELNTIKELYSMYIEAGDKLKEIGWNGTPSRHLYGMTNMHEFLSEGVSAQDFMATLSDIGMKPSKMAKAHIKLNADALKLSSSKDKVAVSALKGMAVSILKYGTELNTHILGNKNRRGYLSNLEFNFGFNTRFDNSYRVNIETGAVTRIADLIAIGKNPLTSSHIKDPKILAELKARADLKAAEGRVAKAMDQMREVSLSEDTIASAKAAGAESVEDLEKNLKKLVETAEVRRRALLDAGYEPEIEPHDIAAIRSAIEGHAELVPQGRGVLYRSIGPRSLKNVRKGVVAAALAGKSYRSLTDDERRAFVTDILMPKIEEAIGNRNNSAGIFSTVSDTRLGKWANGLIGGGAAYGDTAESSSRGLQFLSKILDPTMDLRDGELNGAFNLFSMDLVNAEKNNAFSKSGMLGIKNKIRAMVKTPEAIDKFNDTAWRYLARLEDLPKDTPHRELMVEFIKTVHEHNKLMGETLSTYGNLNHTMVPEEYGTTHIANEKAITDPNGFADALHKHFLAKIQNSEYVNFITAEALGWVHLTRESGKTDDIVSFTVPENSPLAKAFAPKETHDWKNQRFAIAKLGEGNIEKYKSGLVSSEHYVDSWKNLYQHRGPEYTALRRSMEIARDRYLGRDLGDSKTGKPRSEHPGKQRNRSEERILTHNDIAQSDELSQYFHKEIYDLVYNQLNHDYTDALMTKHITEFFGTKMSWSDLVHVLASYGEETMDKANMSLAEIESRRNGYQRMNDVWESHVGKMQEGKDGVDKYYKTVLDNSKLGVLAAGGIKAAISSFGEVGRALLASNQHKAPVIQLVSNLKTALRLAINRGERDALKEVASATHWIRGLSADHMLARSDINPNNPFNGMAMGTRNPGFFQRLASDWRKVGEINKTETNALTRGLNRFGIVSQRLGVPLAYVNDVTTCIHIFNAQKNFTENYGSFMKLAEAIQGRKFSSLKELESLAAKCGIRAKEALNLSTAGMLDPEVIKIIRDAALDQRNYSDGLLDTQKLYRWANGDKAKVDAIDKMGGFINMTARQTNSEPTLLDLRVNQSTFAKSMGIFTQFLLSHSIQEIGRRRRYSSTNYGVHLGGLILMDMITYGLIRNRDDRGTIQQIEEEPIKFMLMTSASLPIYGSYGLWVPVLRAMMTNAYNAATDQKLEKMRFPDLYGAPAENAHIRAYETMAEMFGK